MFKLGTSYPLSEIIQALKSDLLDDDFCLYGRDNQELELTDSYWLDVYPQVEQDQDVYPDKVRQEKLQLLYYGEDMADVIQSVLEQKPSAADEDCLRALLYYYQHDDFLDFE